MLTWRKVQRQGLGCPEVGGDLPVDVQGNWTSRTERPLIPHDDQLPARPIDGLAVGEHPISWDRFGVSQSNGTGGTGCGQRRYQAERGETLHR